MGSLYKGVCKREDSEKLLNMLDDVFFRDDEPERKRSFLKLLPKLYKEKYDPASRNFIVSENGEIKAAVGLYPMTAAVAGKTLKIGGVGNVGVSRDSRGKGYMIDCMNMALEKMKEDNYDYSILGGQRQRYGYFGYEPGGVALSFSINRNNVYHILGRDAETSFTAREITENDVDVLGKIKAAHESLPFYVHRPLESRLDVLKSWRSKAYAAFEGEELKGYFCIEDFGGVLELKAVKTEDTLSLAALAMNVMNSDSISLSVPVFDGETCEYASKICDGSSVCHVQKLNILNYGKFIEAFLAVKAARVSLCPGVLRLLIHGFKRDENLKITVEGSSVSVSENTEAPDLELDRLEAVRFIAGLYSKRRFSPPVFARDWFPVDFYSYNQDNV